MKGRHLKRYLILLYVIWLFTGCMPGSQNVPQVIDGKLNAVKYDFVKPLPLVGKWEFYWGEFLDPADFHYNKTPSRPSFIKVPASWTNQKNPEGKDCPAYGYATYRLLIHLSDSIPTLGLEIPKIWSATKIWANRELIFQAGKVASRLDDYENKIIGKTVMVTPKSGQIELIVQVANYDIFISGIVQNFLLGHYDELLQNKSLKYSWTLMWMGMLFVMGLYHFILYLFRKKNESTLYFGMICLLLWLRLVVFGEHYLYEFFKHHAGWLSFAIQSKIYYITTYLLIPLSLVYVRSLYPGYIKNIYIKISWVITLLYCLFLLFTRPHFSMQTILYYQVAIVVFLIYLVIALVRAALQKEQEASLQAWGILVMVLAGFNDGLHTQGIELFGALELLPAAFAVFLSLQFVVLARRFSRAFGEVEDLSQNLERKVIERTTVISQQKEEIEQQNNVLAEKQNQLEYAYSQIKDSVVYASRIQRSLLRSPEEIISHFKEAFILFQPKDIVSGDFYWFETLETAFWKLKILVVADCTGHGVPGAFMTVMGNDFLNEIVIQQGISNPEQILYELDKKVIHTLQKQGGEQPNDGMEMAILTIDENKNKMIFAGAKHPLYLVRKGQINQFEGSRFPIGSSQYKIEKVFNSLIVDIQEGDTFYLSSDGFQDQIGGDQGRKFLKKRFREYLLEISSFPLIAQKQLLSDSLKKWQMNGQYYAQTDDILVVGIRF